MSTLPENTPQATRPIIPAPIGRRLGAHLLDSGFALLVAYLGIWAISFGYEHGFGGLYLAIIQSGIVGWIMLKDAWWPGQSLGRRIARILIATSQTGQPASRIRGVARQGVFALLLAALYLPAYLYLSQSTESIQQAMFSSILSVGAPIRLLAFLLPNSTQQMSPVIVAHLVVIAFFLLELFLVTNRRDRRRVVDRLVGVTVVDAQTSGK